MSKRELHRQLGILDVTSITAGIVIGAGVFIITGIAAKYAGALTWVSYAIGIIPVLLVGLSTIFLNLLYPVEGGESYVYPTRIVSKPFGFLSGWGMWLALIGPVAITAQAFISYFNALPGISFQVPIIVGAVVVTLVFFIINILGVKTVSIVQNILFLFMVAGIIVYIILGLPHMKGANITMGSPLGFSGVMKGASLLIFAYAGLTLAADLGEEAKNPAKTITWGVMLGALIPAILYVGSAFVSTAVMPWDKFASAKAPYAAVASKYMGALGVAFIVIVAWAAILSSHNGEQAVGARVFFGLSRDKIFGGKITMLNRFGVPVFGLLGTVLIAILLITTGTIQLVAEIIVAMFLYNWIITHIAVLIVPKKYPELYEKLPGFYKKKWFMILPVIGILVSLYLLYLQGWKALLYAAIWMAIGLIIYFIGYSRKKDEISELMDEWPRERYFE
ncbi:MAG: amino acid permease [Spirochaetales bacterium]|nr:amino acid permease [Spirochaetales bacterium]